MNLEQFCFLALPTEQLSLLPIFNLCDHLYDCLIASATADPFFSAATLVPELAYTLEVDGTVTRELYKQSLHFPRDFPESPKRL